MPKKQYFHNPRCSKSRQGLAILEDNNADFEIVEYLKTPPTLDQIKTLYYALGIDSALEMIRPKEAEFKQAGLTKASTNEELLSAIASYPKLLERPILFDGKLAVIGRPPERLRELL